MINSRFIDLQDGNDNQFIIENLKNSIIKRYGQLGHSVKIMHVCGTHESTVSRSGLRSILPKGLEIISGPGCPVCVCPSKHISAAIELAKQGDIIVTFGDMMRVPNAKLESLNDAKAQNLDVRVVYSIDHAFTIAEKNPTRRVIWLGIGFETTAPMTAKILKDCKLDNFYVLTDFRLVVPAMEFIVNIPNHGIDGFILPGHVSVITGSNYYLDFVRKYGIPGVVGGFNPIDFMLALDMLLKQLIDKRAEIENAYPSVVTQTGNSEANKLLKDVFKISDAKWRGIGIIPLSGYTLQEKYKKFDAYDLITIPVDMEQDLMKGCKCGEIILGQVNPPDCRFFKKRCTPETPIGPCMVSDEGTCRIRAVYGNNV